MLKILTLTWNGQEKLNTLYHSFLPTLQEIDYQWYIKDNGSKDNSINLIQQWNNPHIHLIQYSHNRDNFAQGCNILFRAANPQSNDLILLLNNDIIFNDTTSISNMISLLDDNVGVVGTRLLYQNTNKLQHAGVVFHPTYKTPMHFRANEVSDTASQKNREFQAVTGAVWLTTASNYENICRTNISKRNGLDENFIWCFEDIDACLTIKYTMGKKIIYCGKNSIFHEESATLKKNPVNKMFLNHNLKYFFNKWRDKYLIDLDIYSSNPQCNLYQGKDGIST